MRADRTRIAAVAINAIAALACAAPAWAQNRAPDVKIMQAAKGQNFDDPQTTSVLIKHPSAARCWKRRCPGRSRIWSSKRRPRRLRFAGPPI